jgi:hypothetical protein
MKLISRKKENVSNPEGRDYLEAYEKDSIKDVVLLGSNEVVEILAKFQPYPGVYVGRNSIAASPAPVSDLLQMFHCHNAVHSDQGMMSVFNVTRLADLGYGGLDMMLEDPMDTRFRAKAYTKTDMNEIKSKTLPFFASLNAYPDPAALSEVEDRYWSTRTPPSGDMTGPAVKGGGMSGMMGGMMGGNMASHHGGQSANAPKPSSMGSMNGDMASHHGGQSASAPKPSSMGPMNGDMASHHGGQSASAPKPSSMGSMGSDMSSHHGGGSNPLPAAPSAPASASHAGMDMSGMSMGSGNMASHHSGGGMMGMRRT